MQRHYTAAITTVRTAAQNREQFLRSPLAAVAFARHIEDAFARIAEAPHRYPETEHGTREHVLPARFPFTVVERVRENNVIVVAVAHQRREPGYWRRRGP